jgi:hypothetical protein
MSWPQASRKFLMLPKPIHCKTSYWIKAFFGVKLGLPSESYVSIFGRPDIRYARIQ